MPPRHGRWTLVSYAKEADMERIAIVAKLKEGTEARAAELIKEGAPFDPGESLFERHTVYLSSSEVIFVFEAQEVEWLVDSLIDDPTQWRMAEVFDRWRPLLEGSPRLARPQYYWERSSPDAALVAAE